MDSCGQYITNYYTTNTMRFCFSNGFYVNLACSYSSPFTYVNLFILHNLELFCITCGGYNIALSLIQLIFSQSGLSTEQW